jgi:hypothetical protein
MASPHSIHTEAPLPMNAELHPARRNRLARCLRIRFHAGEWHLSEDGSGRVGGIFTTLAAAVAFARGELRGVPGGGVVVDFDGNALDGQAERSS